MSQSNSRTTPAMQQSIAATSQLRGIKRKECLSLLDSGPEARLVMVIAPSGYGKTTLLNQWAESNASQVAWLALHQPINDGKTLLMRMLGAIEKSFPGIGRFGTRPSLEQRSVAEACEKLLNGISSHHGKITLIIDNSQNITDQEAWNAIQFICDNCPPNFTLVLSGRGVPPLRISRLLMFQQARLINARHLAFDASEFDAALKARGIHISNRAKSKVLEASRGWPIISLAIALEEASNPDSERSSKTLAPSLFLDRFLQEEIYSAIPPDTLRFLELISVLPSFTEQQCIAAVSPVDESLAHDAAIHIQRLSNDFSLLQTVSDGLFALQPFLASKLSGNLYRKDRDTFKKVAKAAAAYLLENGREDESIPLLVSAEDWDNASALILKWYSPLGMKSSFARLSEWLDALPDEQFEANPRLYVAKAMSLMTSDRNVEMMQLLDKAENALSPRKPGDDFMVFCELHVLRAYHHGFFSLNGNKVLEHVNLAIEELGDEHAEAIEGTISLMQGVGIMLNGDYTQAEIILRSYLENSRNLSSFLALMCAYYLGTIMYEQGRLMEASQLLGAMQNHVSSVAKQPEEAVGVIRILHAWISYDQNQLKESSDLARRGLFELRTWNAQSAKADALSVLRHCEHVLGGKSDSTDFLADFETVNTPQFAHLSADHPSIRCFNHIKEVNSEESCVGKMKLLRAKANRCMLDHDDEGAIAALSEVREIATKLGLLAYVLESQVARAILLDRTGKTAEADEALAEALSIGESNGNMRTFLDEGEAMRALLKRSKASGTQASFANRLLRAMPSTSKNNAGTTLSNREIEVLAKLAEGSRTQEIAQDLYLSAGTVRTHLHHIYEKLGASNRIEAIKIARDLGVL